MLELETRRLTLRRLRAADAPFIVELLNDAAFIRYIGDRQVRTVEQARDYIAQGPAKSYDEFGFGLLCVQTKENGAALGMCGLVQRNYLPDPDIGFAFLPQYRAQGFCMEASRAVLDDAFRIRKLRRISAIVQPDNAASLALLKKLGFVVDRLFRRSVDEPEIYVLAYCA